MKRPHCRFLYGHIKRCSSSDTASILTTREIQPSYDAVVIGGGKWSLYINLSIIATFCRTQWPSCSEYYPA